MKIFNYLEQPFGTLSECLRIHAAERPHAIVLIQDDRSLTLAAFDSLVDRVAASLQADGAQPGACLAICAATSFEYLAVFLGGLRAGVTVAPLAPTATADSLHSMILDAGASFVFIGPEVATALHAGGVESGCRRILLGSPLDADAFERWLAPKGAQPAVVDIPENLPFNIIYSSGTTGTPKGIVQSHLMRWRQVQKSPLLLYGADTVSMVATPLYSNTTLTGVLPTLALGGINVLMDRFDAGRYLELAECHRATHAMLVPVQYQRLMAHPDMGRRDLSSFMVKLCTSAPFHQALKMDVLTRWPGGLIEYYGMTEGGGTCMLVAHEHLDKLHTVGTPIEGHDIRLIDEEGREVPRGEIGEVVGHSGTMMNGYHHQPGKTSDAEWFDPTGKCFIRTGDIGRFDEDGFLVLMDRKKDMIISGGFNVYPSDLEDVLRRHPGVAEAAVVGVPSEVWGETPVGFVVLRGKNQPGCEELLAWVNARLGKTQRLARLRAVQALPRSAIGKILKRELRDSFDAQTEEL